jgi:hypothetical protein
MLKRAIIWSGSTRLVVFQVWLSIYCSNRWRYVLNGVKAALLSPHRIKCAVERGGDGDCVVGTSTVEGVICLEGVFS